MVQREVSPAERQAWHIERRWPLYSGVFALVLVVLGGVMIGVRASGVVPYAIDSAWMNRLYASRTPTGERIAVVFDWLGGGVVGTFVVPLAVIGVLLLLGRRWAAIYFLIAVLLSAGLVQLLKNTVERPRPEQILVHTDFGSFPSGHTANAATLAVVLALVVRRAWVWAVGMVWVVAMMISRNYLGAHWLTDTLGGVLLGVAVALIVWAPFAHRLYEECPRTHP